MIDLAKPLFKDGRNLQPVWRCIYCGVEHSDQNILGKEHIIPNSIGGEIILPRSSCDDCGKVTSFFEYRAIREYNLTRMAFKMPSYRPDDRPDCMVVTVKELDGSFTEINIPAEDVNFFNMALPEFPAPNLISGAAFTENYSVKIRILNGQIDDRSSGMSNGIDGVEKQFTNRFTPQPFALMLAKIAHSFSVAQYGIDAAPWLLPHAILTDRSLLTDYVGGINRPEYDDEPSVMFVGPIGERVTANIGHTIRVENVKAADGHIYTTILINLFSEYLPTYRVIVA